MSQHQNIQSLDNGYFPMQPQERAVERPRANAHQSRATNQHAPRQSQQKTTPVQTATGHRPNTQVQNRNTQGQNKRPPLPPADFNMISTVVDSAKDSFERISAATGLDVKFYEEAVYARQLIEANYNNARNKQFSLAYASPESIRKAVTLVANSGLTLNPQLGLAYLVPRWNKNAGLLECHLEPSYKGLRRLGVDSGAIDTAVAELVYENDTFKWVDRYSKPQHDFNPFDINRGKLIGGYCLARRPDGSFITTPVNTALLAKIQALSFGGVWNDWYEQMVSKSIIRQGFKDWPITSTGPIAARLAAMQDYLRKVDETSYSASEYAPTEQPYVPNHTGHDNEHYPNEYGHPAHMEPHYDYPAQ
ncbi:RecT family recombinase [Vibrio atlanticus]|uniref:RecT family recombinase n=1 Tax=Vibrio atlanticus TaxID=693153 RepID=UPI0022B043B0|nr:RecT family recombinase [Vibrio atlanticus]MCZ4311018.1 recombinase RecT [Vibrio atlanticus]